MKGDYKYKHISLFGTYKDKLNKLSLRSNTIKPKPHKNFKIFYAVRNCLLSALLTHFHNNEFISDNQSEPYHERLLAKITHSSVKKQHN